MRNMIEERREEKGKKLYNGEERQMKNKKKTDKDFREKNMSEGIYIADTELPLPSGSTLLALDDSPTFANEYLLRTTY